ncbi:MAG: hypothetical protein JXB39_10910, partial [Deltaproteobacteria bacterium]|nr:hypothetical protein [Deltaproteobacteria bacterium]
ALVVPAPDFDRMDQPVEVVLVLPGGAEVASPARVSALLPDGVGFALELAAGQRRALAAAARENP